MKIIESSIESVDVDEVVDGSGCVLLAFLSLSLSSSASPEISVLNVGMSAMRKISMYLSNPSSSDLMNVTTTP